MSTTIHKFTAEVVDDPQPIKMAPTAAIVRVEPSQRGIGFVDFWAIVDDEHPTTHRVFVVTGTGHPVADGLRYVGTAVGRPLVWHLWEVAA